MRTALLFVLSFFFFCASFLFAQTAAELDLILGTKEINFAQAGRFVLVTAGEADEGIEAGAAFALAKERGWMPRRAAPDASIKQGELCFLIMEAFKMKGSFLYAAFPGPRYAFRELNYLELIPGQRDPGIKVSGERFLQILGMAAVYAEAVRKAPGQTAAGEAPALAIERIGAVSLGSVYFGPNSAELAETEKAKLRDMSAVLAQHPGAKVVVGGYTAMAGSEGGRLWISIERARAAADYLISLEACREENIIVQGYGAQRPRGNNSTEEGMAVNRRVEVILLNGNI
jgi:outer membrane protein OmpA-like peptidoglycan-associated protein